jgi:hypothetical protein
MKSQREQITEIRDDAIRAGEGHEPSAQKLYPQYGALSRDEFKGLALGLSTWLRDIRGPAVRHVHDLYLKNGAQLLDFHALADGAVVLAFYQNQYVVWTLDTDGNAFRGHYADAYQDAYKTFKHVCGLYFKMESN